MHGVLELNESAPANSGARLDVTSADAISVQPSTVAPGKIEIADTVERQIHQQLRQN